MGQTWSVVKVRRRNVLEVGIARKDFLRKRLELAYEKWALYDTVMVGT